MEAEERYLYHYAEQQLERGRSVIPLIGKKPAIDWKPYQRRRPALGQLAAWFGYMNANGKNYGVVTGKVSDLIVVDCDSREEAVWWWRNFPKTPEIVLTGRGTHFYYRYGETGNRTGVLGRKIDIRGDGGYVVGEGSIHPETGTVYERVDVSKLDLDEVPTFDPSWIETVKTVNSGASDVRNAVAYISKIQAVSGEGGHNATFRAACKLRDGGLSEAEALEALIHWNETNCEPPWTLRELVHKVKGAYRTR